VNILNYGVTFLTNFVAGNHEFCKTFLNILLVEKTSNGGY